MLKFLIIILLVSFTTVPAQDNGNSIKFQKALKEYSAQNYPAALDLFREIHTSVVGSKSGIALLFTGKTELKLNRLQDARHSVIEFLRDFPDSRYRDEGRLTLAKIYISTEEYADALQQLLYLMEETELDEYERNARETASNGVAAWLSSSELETMQMTTTGEKARPFLLLLTGKSYHIQNNKLEADAAFLEIMQDFPYSLESKEASRLYDSEVKLPVILEDTTVPVIAILLPLTRDGKGSDAVMEILEGIKFAFAEYNDSADQKIGLHILDTEDKPSKIEDLKDELLRIKSLKLILGPVFSDEVRAALRVFAEQDIPIISPTATDDDLVEINDYFFQANPSFSMRGRAMAQFIYFVENKRKIGVLSAAEGYSPSLSLSFTSEFERLGGQILFREIYRTGSFELQDQARRIAAFSGELEGIYVPLSDKTDAPAVINELLMNNVDIALYGNQDWFYVKSAVTSSLSENLTFTSDYFIEYNNPEYQHFAKEFNLRTRMDANRNVLYGYDAAVFILETVKVWEMEPPRIKQAFQTGMTLKGFHNNIAFDDVRINQFLRIIRVKEGIFELLDTFKTSLN